jgi:hypothetical protein
MRQNFLLCRKMVHNFMFYLSLRYHSVDNQKLAVNFSPVITKNPTKPRIAVSAFIPIIDFIRFN